MQIIYKKFGILFVKTLNELIEQIKKKQKNIIEESEEETENS
jgi:hypothetical protein